MADLFPVVGESEEQCVHGADFCKGQSDKNFDCCIKFDDAIPNMAVQALTDTISIVSGGIAEDVVTEPESVVVITINSEIVEDADTELESILVVPIYSEIAEAAAIELTSVLAVHVDPVYSESEGSDDGNSGSNIDQAGENLSAHETAMQLITRAIPEVGALTVTAVVHATHSEPASGVVSGHNKLLYNVTLGIIFALGVAELFTGVWLSMSGLTYRRRLWIGGIVLFLSIWPLVGILSIGGLA